MGRKLALMAFVVIGSVIGFGLGGCVTTQIYPPEGGTRTNPDSLVMRQLMGASLGWSQRRGSNLGVATDRPFALPEGVSASTWREIEGRTGLAAARTPTEDSVRIVRLWRSAERAKVDMLLPRQDAERLPVTVWLKGGPTPVRDWDVQRVQQWSPGTFGSPSPTTMPVLMSPDAGETEPVQPASVQQEEIEAQPQPQTQSQQPVSGTEAEGGFQTQVIIAEPDGSAAEVEPSTQAPSSGGSNTPPSDRPQAVFEIPVSGDG